MQMESLRADNLVMNTSITTLKDNLNTLTNQFTSLFLSSKCNSKTGLDTEPDTNNYKTQSVKVDKKKEPRLLPVFKGCSEISDDSLLFKNFTDKLTKGVEVDKSIAEFRLDSSSSQTYQPFDLVFEEKNKKKPSIIFNKQNISNTSSKRLYTPENQFSEFSNQENENKNKESKTQNIGIKIKDFSNFKELLKDLRLSLHLSEVSMMKSKTDKGISEAELLMKEYADLDREICDLAEPNNQSIVFGHSPQKKIDRQLDVKKSQSLNLGYNSKTIYKCNLEHLKNSSNIHEFELKLSDVKENPELLDSYMIELKKELNVRRNKFEEIKGLLV